MEENRTPEAAVQPDVKPEEAAPRAEAQSQPSGAELEAAREAATRKARKRRRRGFRNLLLRVVLILLVSYVLLFQIIGLTTMPNGDMYPRIDAGDLVMFYRLDKDIRAQDIVAFEKKAVDIKDYQAPEEVDIEETEAPPAEEAEPETPAETPAPVVTPAPNEKTPAEIVADQSLLGKFNRLVYNAGRWLNLRGEEGTQLYICRAIAGPGDTVEITDDGSVVVNGNHMIEGNIFSRTTPYIGFTEYPLKLAEDECFVLADLRDGGADSRFFGPVKKSEILGTVITIARRNNL